MGTSSDLKGIDQIGESIEKQDQLDEKDKAFSSNQPELKYKFPFRVVLRSDWT